MSFEHIPKAGLVAVVVLMLNCITNNKEPGEKTVRSLDSTQLKQYAASYTKGQQIFWQYCNTCHRAPEGYFTDNILIDGILERHTEQYFINFITDSRSLRVAGDRYALGLDKAYDSDYEHLFKDSLSTQSLSELALYIKVAAKQRYRN